jgi:uncharacterized protein (DUF433 family)
MLARVNDDERVIGRGVYGPAEALQLLNFKRDPSTPGCGISRKTVTRWLMGYDYVVRGEKRHSDPLWRPDYTNDNQHLEISFRDLIELRFVKAFRDAGLTLPTIQECFLRAVEEVQDERPFSTSKFRTDGKTIFLDITHDVHEGEMIDLRRRQSVFRTVVEPSLRDLEFDAAAVARWYPLGRSRRSIVVDPARAFGRPITALGGVPTEVLSSAVLVEGSPEKVARLYEVPLAAVRDAVTFQGKLAA